MSPAEAQRLNEEVARLYKQGKYDEALPLAERSLSLREKALGPDDTDVAASLNILASLYQDKGDYASAEPLFKRALHIREKALAPDHQQYVVCLARQAHHVLLPCCPRRP